MSSVASRIRSVRIKTPSDLETWGSHLTLLVVTALAFLTRIYRLEANGLRTDEMYSLWMANRTIPDLLQTVIVEGHDATPPTFNLILHFMWRISQELWSVRLVSVLAGVALVWITFLLARRLFDFRVAALSALLLAISPFSIEYSQVARAYSLSALLAFLSLAAFILIWNRPGSRSYQWAYFIATLAALGTHYAIFVVVIFENLAVAAMAIARQISRQQLLGWIRLQALTFVASLPIIWLAIRKIPMAETGLGQSWLAEPSILGMARTLILWGTGDPSFGGSRITLARLLSMALLVSVLALGAATAWKRWRENQENREEVMKVVFVASAFLAPWLIALGISFFRRIFHEKYFVFVVPFLLITVAWTILRMKPIIAGRGLLVVLLGTTLIAMATYHSSPSGEQWREALSYIKQERQSTDQIAVMPGFYVQPVAYYLNNKMPPDDYSLSDSAIVIIDATGNISGLTRQTSIDGSPEFEVLSQSLGLWLITGYAGIAPEDAEWFFERYTVIDERDYLGVSVIRGDRR